MLPAIIHICLERRLVFYFLTFFNKKLYVIIRLFLYIGIVNFKKRIVMEKYKLTDETINVNGATLYRIEALRHFNDVCKGDKGGFIENERNLSQFDDCWVYGNAMVYEYAMVYDNARVFDEAEVCGNARVYGNALVYGSVLVCGDARVHGNADIRGDARIESMRDYIVFKNWWSSGRYFTWTRSNNMWKVGCFYGSGEELIEKAYKDSEESGDKYKAVVEYVESMFNKK